MTATPPPLHEPSAQSRVDIDQRLTELEIKLSFSEDLVDHLNAIVSRQQQQLDTLLRDVRQLQAQRAEDGSASFRSLHDELPPHY